MIVKVKSHKRPSFRTLLNYMVNNKDRLFDTSGNSLLVTHNLRGNEIESWVKQFRRNEEFRLRRRIDSVYCTHEILSWHRDDSSNITTAKLEKIARTYMKMRNPSGMYIAVPHFDRDHYHLHICASGIEYRTGKSMRLSKQAFAKLKVDIQEYQLEHYPEFSRSRVNHGKSADRKAKQDKAINSREKDKQKVQAILKTCYKKANSLETFSQLLTECGAEIYYRAGKMTGVVYRERKYRFLKLGFEESRFNELNNITLRQNGLRKIRDKNHKITLER
jgi:hypothetical protein